MNSSYPKEILRPDRFIGGMIKMIGQIYLFSFGYLFPPGMFLVLINNLIIIIFFIKSSILREKLSKTARIYYICLAVGQMFAGTIYHFPAFAGTITNKN